MAKVTQKKKLGAKIKGKKEVGLYRYLIRFIITLSLATLKPKPINTTMAILSAPSCSYMATSSSSLSLSSSSSTRPSIVSPFNSSKSPFVGFSVALSKIRPLKAQTFNGGNGRRGLRVRCEDAPHVPVDQRWLFEQSEVDGPVCSSLFPLSVCFPGKFLKKMWKWEIF